MVQVKTALLITISAIFLFAILPSLASAEVNAEYQIKQYSVFDIQRNCINNGTFCQVGAVCNISINSLNNNGTYIVRNKPMTNSGAGMFNFTLSGADTRNTGFFHVTVVCEELHQKGSEEFFYQVTTTGEENNTTMFIIIGMAFCLLIAFGYLLRNEYIVFIGGTTALISGIYGMIYGFGNVQNDFTRMLSLIIIGIGIIFTIMPAYQLVENGGSPEYEEVEEITSE